MLGLGVRVRVRFTRVRVMIMVRFRVLLILIGLFISFSYWSYFILSDGPFKILFLIGHLISDFVSILSYWSSVTLFGPF